MANRSGRFLGGLLVGAALGTLGGMLMAPRSGRDTRKLIRKSADALPELAEDLASSLQGHAGWLSDTARHRWDDTLSRLQEAITEGIVATQQQRQLLQQGLGMADSTRVDEDDDPPSQELL
jgi:gas vesicle protein